MNEQTPGAEETAHEVAAQIPPTEPPSDKESVIGPPMEPVREPERIYALDVLRGFAIFGIFMVNIAFFAMPLMGAIAPQLLADGSPGDQVCHAIVRAFFEFKFVSLFSLLFGVGLIVQMRRAEQRGRPFVPMYLRRTFLLMLFGLAHGLLLWYGDILFIYSVVAVIALLLRTASVRALIALFAAAVLISVLATAAFAALSVLAQSQSLERAVVQPTEVAEVSESTEVAAEPQGSEEMESAASEGSADDRWQRFRASLEKATWQPGDEASADVAVIAYKEGPMTLTLLMRAITFGIMLVFVAVSGFGFRVLGMFLLGMALMKLDFFNERRRAWHWAFCIVGLAVGVAGELLLVWSYHASNYQVGWTQAGAEVLHTISSFALCLGYVGTIILIVRSGLLNWLTYAFSCVGRTALSNYLLQTIVATYIMYWWGLGLFNDVSRPQQLAMVVGIYMAQLVLSVLYLRVFRIGPFEWLWRSLTYLKLQPILRQTESTSPTVG